LCAYAHAAALAPDELIVTHPVFLRQAQELKQYREASNLDDVASVEVVTTDWVYSRYPDTLDHLSALRRYLQAVVSDTLTRPKYVLLLGDAGPTPETQDEALLPTQTIMRIRGSVACDDWFVTVVDTTDTLGDIPPVAIGRISVSDTVELRAVLNKIYAYERDRGHYRKRFGFVVGDDRWWKSECCIWPYASYWHGLDMLGRMSDTHDLRVFHSICYEPTGPYRIRNLQSDLMSEIANGLSYLYYLGPAYNSADTTAWGRWLFFDAEEVVAQLSPSSPFIMLPHTNEGVGFHQTYHCAAEKLMFAQDAGAVAAVAATFNEAVSDIYRKFTAEMFKHIEAPGGATIGTAFLAARVALRRLNTAGVPWMALLGDPAMPIPSVELHLDVSDTIVGSPGIPSVVAGNCTRIQSGTLSAHVYGAVPYLDSVSGCGTELHHRQSRPLLDSLTAPIEGSRFSFSYAAFPALADTQVGKISLYAEGDGGEEVGFVHFKPGDAGVVPVVPGHAPWALQCYSSQGAVMIAVVGAPTQLGRFTLEIFDALGRRTLRDQIPASGAYRWSAPTAGRGFYVVRVTSASGLSMTRAVVTVR